MPQATESQRPRATPQKWEDVRRSYIEGEGSLRQLARRHGLSLSTVEARCRREDWVRLRQKRQDAALEKVVGTSSARVITAPVQDADWWAEHDKEHLLENLELTRRLRQAVEQRITGASATELERLAGAASAIASTERELLELTPRSPKSKAPSLRPNSGHSDRHYWHRYPPVPFVETARTPLETTGPPPTETGQPQP